MEWVKRRLTRQRDVEQQRRDAARAQERGYQVEEFDLVTNDDGDVPYSNDPVLDLGPQRSIWTLTQPTSWKLMRKKF